MPLEDIDILKLKEGDHRVFQAIYEGWNRKVYFYYLKKTDNEDASKELTQQVFIKLWTYRESVSIVHSIDQQIFQKARLIYIDWLRVEATHRKHFAGGPEITTEISTQSADSNLEDQQDIEYSINRLPPKRRKVFELKHIHGYSYKEIAEHLGITVKTVDNHLLKAASQLRKALNL
jgi:RNA polymerase sigma-19 factor, ECF subfamily